MKTLGSIAALALGAALAACSHEPARNAVTAPTSPVQAASNCPIHRNNAVQATIGDTPEGANITFTAVDRNVEALRADVRAMDAANASRGDPFAVCGCIFESGSPGPAMANSGMGTDGWTYEGNPPSNQTLYERGQTMMQPMAAVPASTSVDVTPDGAVLSFRAKDGSEVQPLRDEIRENVEAMRHDCGAH